MRPAHTLLTAGMLFMSASALAAQEYVPTPPPTGPAAAPTTTLPPAPPAAPVPAPACAYYSDHTGHVGRHPLFMWLTYVPARRPWIDGNLCQKVPNILPPVYDYHPCPGYGCGPDGCAAGSIGGACQGYRLFSKHRNRDVGWP